MKFEKYFDKQLKRNCWRVDVTINGYRHRKGKFASKADAERFITTLQQKALSYRYGVAQPEIVTVNELLTELTTPANNSAQRVVMGLLREAIDADKPVQSLSRVDMAAFKSACDEREFQPATLAQYRGVLYAMLNRAGELFESLGDWHPPKFPRIGKVQSRQRVLSTDELKLLLACWGKNERMLQEQAKGVRYRLRLYDIARMMLLTGARREEIEAITIEQIDWKEGWLNLKSGKVKRSHLIYQHWDKIAQSLSGIGCVALTGESLIDAINRADELSDDHEKLWGELFPVLQRE